MKKLIQRENITFTNIYASGIRALKYIKQILKRPKERSWYQYNNRNSIPYLQHFTDNLDRESVKKHWIKLNIKSDGPNRYILNIPSRAAEHTLFHTAHGTLPGIDLMLDHKRILN